MMWDLPIYVSIDGKKHKIRNQCDYRVVLDALSALNDVTLGIDKRLKCALYIFYENASDLVNVERAINEMMRIMNNGCDESDAIKKPKTMDWQYDFHLIAPAVSKVLGYDIRTPDKFTHWNTFLGAYLEIGDCVYSTVVNIRKKRAKGKKLDKWEETFCRENPKIVNLPQQMTEEERMLLDSNW